ncbi:hypothetical protein E2C01_093324 [Portunus trituberculatus]|uniref:Uncharacterized protein n=1 Tax=Portunus trituberculatus TaxID=210409 RepID=A0A5B7JXT0_PORTR|nr:hypothetical protein [Portunus trituberculatus]
MHYSAKINEGNDEKSWGLPAVSSASFPVRQVFHLVLVKQCSQYPMKLCRRLTQYHLDLG